MFTLSRASFVTNKRSKKSELQQNPPQCQALLQTVQGTRTYLQQTLLMTRILFDFFSKQDYLRARFTRANCCVVLLHTLVHYESAFLCIVTAKMRAL